MFYVWVGIVFSVLVAVVHAVLVAAVHAVGRRCWLLCAAGHAWLLSWLVAGVVAGFRGRAVCWSFEGLQLRSER